MTQPGKCPNVEVCAYRLREMRVNAAKLLTNLTRIAVKERPGRPGRSGPGRSAGKLPPLLKHVKALVEAVRDAERSLETHARCDPDVFLRIQALYNGTELGIRVTSSGHTVEALAQDSSACLSIVGQLFQQHIAAHAW
jgi:hypothetical protein